MENDKYNSIQVALHWLSAALILLSLTMGIAVLDRVEGGLRLTVLRTHLIVGGLIGFLMLGRLAVRLLTVQPPRLATPWQLHRLTSVVHIALYFAVLGMVASGIALAAQSQLPMILFGGDSFRLPKDFSTYASHSAHATFATLLIALLAAHVAGAAFHSFTQGGKAFRRMWFEYRGQAAKNSHPSKI